MSTQQAINRAVLSYLKALFGLMDTVDMNPRQRQQAINRALAEKYLHLRNTLHRMDKSLASIEAKEIQVRRRGHADAILRVTAERARLGAARAEVQTEFNEVLPRFGELEVMIREEEKRIRDKWRWPW